MVGRWMVDPKCLDGAGSRPLSLHAVQQPESLRTPEGLLSPLVALRFSRTELSAGKRKAAACRYPTLPRMRTPSASARLEICKSALKTVCEVARAAASGLLASAGSIRTAEAARRQGRRRREASGKGSVCDGFRTLGRSREPPSRRSDATYCQAGRALRGFLTCASCDGDNEAGDVGRWRAVSSASTFSSARFRRCCSASSAV